MPRTMKCWSSLLAALELSVVVFAYDPTALSLEASDWLGDDGNWSTVKFMLGSQSEEVNVLVSTTLSELWAIENTGCYPEDPLCSSHRGGLYDPRKSNHRTALGAWQLGQSWLGIGANGDYGLDTLNSYSSISDTAFGMSNVVIAAINTTDFFTGFFGLGMNSGNFGKRVASPPLTQAVETFGWIPSYSYGYTAGAHYRNAATSVTLGGYDSLRLHDHGINFSLDPKDSFPKVLIRGIEAKSASSPKKDSDVQVLSSYNQSFTALIDSTTPYMWLPSTICDTFASAFNLTYNKTLDLYTLSNDQFDKFQSLDSLAFDFALSSYDNRDDFGHPLNVAGVVNISVPVYAFASTLQFPFHNETIQYGDPAVPYFSLRRSPDNDTFIVGRSFLQESYLVTRYDEGTFSLYQAKFPDSGNDIVTIARPPNSPLPGPLSASSSGLSAGQYAGIAVGVIMILTLIVSGVIWCRRRRSRRFKSQPEAMREIEEIKEDDDLSVASQEPPRTLRHILTHIVRRRPSDQLQATTSPSRSGPVTAPSEVPASEIYELPAPGPPVELDGIGTDEPDDAEASLGSEYPQDPSSYEVARRRMERQLQGPVPEYTPPLDGVMPSPEKWQSERQANTARQPGGGTQPSPISPSDSPLGDGTNSLPMALPSPITPREDGSNMWAVPASLPNTVTANDLPARLLSRGSADRVGSLQGPTSNPSNGELTVRSQSDSNSSVSPVSPSSINLPPASFAVQRAPIEPSKVVCLGPIPDELQPSSVNTIPRVVEPESEPKPEPQPSGPLYPGQLAKARLSESSLGSNFTAEEEEEQDSSEEAHISSREPASRSPGHADQERPSTLSLQSSGSLQDRIDHSQELVHVPQMAHKRYSWEE